MKPGLLAAIAGLCLGAAIAPHARTVRMAIVAGHNHGEPQDIPLKYAESDADRFSSLLTEIGGLDQDNIILLKSPTPALLRCAFSELTRKAKALAGKDDVIFYFYFSGHGDKARIKLGAQGFPLEDLRGLIDSLPAKIRIGVFDACQSGSITHLKGGKAVEPLVLEQETNGNGTILITSSSADENSQESENLQGSFFTHHWLSGLRGPADLSGDKHVSLMEAYQYAFQKTVVNTEGTTGGIQHPNARFQMDVAGDIILTDLTSGDGGIRFPPEVEGNFLIVDRNSVIMAEFQKEAKREIFLALGPGTYTVFKKDGKNLRHAETEIAQGRITVFDEKGLRRGTLYANYTKGGGEKPTEVDSRDAAQQRPYSVYVGLMSEQSFAGEVGANYTFLPPLALDFRYFFLNMADAGNGRTYAFKPGLEFHRFASSRDLQLSLRAGYSWGYRPGFVREKGVIDLCVQGDNGTCNSPSAEVFRQHTFFDLWEASFGIRYWIFPMLSLDASVGMEYGKIWRREKHEIRTQPFLLGMGVHF